MKKIIYLLCLVSVFGLVTACKLAPKKEEPPQQVVGPVIKYQQWDAKALIKNTSTGEANILNLDLLAQPKFPIRVEVNTSLGIQIASIVIAESEIEILLTKAKKYYHGPLSQKALRPVVGVALDPRLLVAALYDESFPDWKCEAQDGKIAKCETAAGEKIAWFYNESAGKRVEITGENFESQIQVKSPVELSSVKEDTFALKVPENYKKFLLKL